MITPPCVRPSFSHPPTAAAFTPFVNSLLPSLMHELIILHDGSLPATEISSQLASNNLLKDSCKPPELLPTDLYSLPSSGYIIVLVAASADGTAERCTRSLARTLKDAPQGALDAVNFVLILLGGARCTNSAQSTKDEVYRSGRKLGSLLSACGAERVNVDNSELDIELEDIEKAVAVWAGAIHTWLSNTLTQEPVERNLSLEQATTEAREGDGEGQSESTDSYEVSALHVLAGSSSRPMSLSALSRKPVFNQCSISLSTQCRPPSLTLTYDKGGAVAAEISASTSCRKESKSLYSDKKSIFKSFTSKGNSPSNSTEKTTVVVHVEFTSGSVSKISFYGPSAEGLHAKIIGTIGELRRQASNSTIQNVYERGSSSLLPPTAPRTSSTTETLQNLLSQKGTLSPENAAKVKELMMSKTVSPPDTEKVLPPAPPAPLLTIDEALMKHHDNVTLDGANTEKFEAQLDARVLSTDISLPSSRMTSSTIASSQESETDRLHYLMSLKVLSEAENEEVKKLIGAGRPESLKLKPLQTLPISEALHIASLIKKQAPKRKTYVLHGIEESGSDLVEQNLEAALDDLILNTHISKPSTTSKSP